MKKLRAEIKTIQKQLRRLQHYSETNTKNLDELGALLQKSKDEMTRRAIGIAIDATLGMVGGALDETLERAGLKLVRAKRLLKAEKNPARRKRLQNTIQALSKIKNNTNLAKYLVVERAEMAKKTYDRVQLAKSGGSDLEKAGLQIHAILKDALTSKELQKALAAIKGAKKLPIGRVPVVQLVTNADTIVDTGFDLTVYFKNAETVRMGDKSSEAYLRAVKRLSGRMEETVRKLKALETK